MQKKTSAQKNQLAAEPPAAGDTVEHTATVQLMPRKTTRIAR